MEAGGENMTSFGVLMRLLRLGASWERMRHQRKKKWVSKAIAHGVCVRAVVLRLIGIVSCMAECDQLWTY